MANGRVLWGLRWRGSRKLLRLHRVLQLQRLHGVFELPRLHRVLQLPRLQRRRVLWAAGSHSRPLRLVPRLQWVVVLWVVVPRLQWLVVLRFVLPRGDLHLRVGLLLRELYRLRLLGFVLRQRLRRVDRD